MISQDRYAEVIVVIIKSLPDIRKRVIEDPSHLQKIETFISAQSSEKNRSKYIKEVKLYRFYPSNHLARRISSLVDNGGSLRVQGCIQIF
jgi:hypothetical protein